MKKTLIIKTGHSETFCTEVDQYPSLGDVLRSTVLLNSSYDEEFFWLVSPEAMHLIPLDNEHVFFWDENGCEKLTHYHFDRVINLEKGDNFLRFLSLLDAQEFLGFIESSSVVCTPQGLKPIGEFTRSPWQKGLFEILNLDWTNEEYVLHHRFKEATFDVGINWQVGEKWKNKNLDIQIWKSLEQSLISRGYRVSWQEGLSNLQEYIDWVASNRLILTLDSLGLHLGLALNKKVVALFGPTPSNEIHMYGRGEAILNSAKECLPCQRRLCLQNKSCMQELDEKLILERVEAHLEGSDEL